MRSTEAQSLSGYLSCGYIILPTLAVPDQQPLSGTAGQLVEAGLPPSSTSDSPGTTRVGSLQSAVMEVALGFVSVKVFLYEPLSPPPDQVYPYCEEIRQGGDHQTVNQGKGMLVEKCSDEANRNAK